MNVSRRALLAGAMGAAGKPASPNNRIRLGLIGSGSRGSYLMRIAQESGQVEWAGICDAWDVRRQEAAAALERGGVSGVALFADHRRLLDRKDLDAVIVATTDHWHARMTIDACEAGKDVYVEKPMTARPEEGPPVVEAVRRTKRVVQVGVQQRSMQNFIDAKKRFFDTGLIGRVNVVRTIWNANGGYLTPVPPGMETKPPGLDWEAVLGPLPKFPWDPKRYFNRFAYWDFSCGGQTGGLFVHMVDVVHWFLNLKRAESAVALGGIYRYDDGRDTPDTIHFILRYPEKLNVTFEATLTDGAPRERADIVFVGSGGRLSIFRGHLRFIPSPENEAVGEITGKGAPEHVHMLYWLDAIRTRRTPNANVVDGHYSSMACHIGNLAYREKRQVDWKKEWDV